MNHFIKFLFIACFSLFTNSAFGQSWSMKTANLMTPFASTIDTSNVLGEYPRPQMVREAWMNLNGIWQFQPGTSVSESIPVGNLSSKILVPFPVESAISGIMTHYDKLWYRRTFTVPTEWAGQRLLLHFGAIDYESQVYINGVSLGIHKGGYDSFTYDITSKITVSGPQVLTVRVFDPTSKGGQPRGKQALNPSGIMYTCTSGIWQSVWLEPVPQTSISEIKLVPDIDQSVLNLKVSTEGDATNQTVSVLVKDGDNIVTTFNGLANTNLVIPVPNPKLWSPNSPFLYNISINLKSGSQSIDSLTSYFGMRKVSVGNVDGFQKMMLNNKFVFQMGPLDQGFWPDGLYTAPTDSAIRFDLYKLKEFGFNMVRKHIKVEPARWYYWADKLGLMVWQDMPSANSYSEQTVGVDEAEFNSELLRLVKTHWNTPSIVMWVIFNESQGQQNTESLVSQVRTLDSTRLINQASGGSYYGVGDVMDIHSYPAPGCPTSSIQTLACGEYGGIGYSIADHLWNPNSSVGYIWVNSADALAELYNTYANSLVQYKTSNGLSAAVYTELTDVEVELNGLMTYDRKVIKTDAQKINLSNTKVINTNFYLTEVLPNATTEPQSWKYTFDQPSQNWYDKTFDDSEWLTGQSGFGTIDTPGSIINTIWDSNDIWIRKEFYIGDLSPEYMDSLVLLIHHDEDCEVYLNNISAATLTGYTTNYTIEPISSSAKNALVPNSLNTIAIHCNQTIGGQYIDAGISIATNEKLSPTGVKKVNVDGITLFPNPVVDQINLNGLEKDKNSATIFNAQGALVLQKNDCGNSIDVSNLSEGFYILRIKNNNKSFSFKFFKEK